MKKSILMAALIMMGLSASAQFGLGGQVNYSKYFAGNPSFIGFGVNLSLVIADNYPIRLSANFGLPQTIKGSATASALSDTTDPGSVNVTDNTKITLLNFWLDAQKYFGSGGYQDGGVYGFFGLGYTSAKGKESIGSYDHTLYEDISTADNASVGQLGIRLGLGYDKGFDFGNLFLEAGLNLSANEANGQAVEVKLPSFLLVNVGLRHWLGSTSGGHSHGHSHRHSQSHFHHSHH